MCDINPAKIENIKEKTTNKDAVYFTDYIEMLDSGLCDAVLVEVPHYQHPEMVIECLKRGIHVISEKPAGVYTKQVREMNEFAEKSDAVFGMMFNQRTNCVYRKMREMIADGAIGELQRVTWIITDWYRTQSYYDGGSWRATWAGEGGGVLFNQCPHQLDLLQWVTGMMPKKVHSFCHVGKWHDIEVEDDVTVYMEFENGATGVFVTSTGDTPGTNRLEIMGDKGKIVCQGDKTMNVFKFYKLATSEREFCKTSKEGFKNPVFEEIDVETDGKNPQHVGILNNFSNAILGLEPLFVEGVEGIRGVELMDSMLLSTWLGKSVELPIDDDLYLAELNKRIATGRVKEGGDVVLDTEGSYGSKRS